MKDKCEFRDQYVREVHYCTNKNFCKNQFNYGSEKFCKIPLIREAERTSKLENEIKK